MRRIETGHYPIALKSLPNTWAIVSVGDASTNIQPGFPCGMHNRDGVGVPHIRPMNIDRTGRLDLTVVKYVSADNVPRLHFGDVLFNNTNSAELIGKTTFINTDMELAFSNHMTRVRPAMGINSRFIAYQLHFLWMMGYFRHRCTHHVNQASVSSSTLADSVPLIIAPTTEQQRIVDEIEKQFTRLDAAVVALKRVQANLERYRASVLKSACEGRLVPTEAELTRRQGRTYEPASVLLERILAERRSRWELKQHAKFGAFQLSLNGTWKSNYPAPTGPVTKGYFPIPEGWKYAALGEIAELKGGLTKGQKRRASEIVRLVPYLRVANVQRGYLNLSEIKTIEATNEEITELRLLPGDVLFNEGGDRDKLGRGWIWEGKIEQCVHQNHVFRARFYSNLMEPRFVSWYGNSVAQRYFNDEGKQTTNLASINMTKLSALPVPVPPLAEQRRIVAELDRRLSVIDEAEAQIEANLVRGERLRQSVLKRAFEGKLLPQNPNDEPAIALLEKLRDTTYGRAVPVKQKIKLRRRSSSVARVTANA